jgi:hypothetical protein
MEGKRMHGDSISRAVLLFLFVFIFAAYGCGGDDGPTGPTPPPDISGAMAIHKALGETAVLRYDELLEKVDPSAARAQLIAELDTTAGVSEAGLGEDSTTVWWKVENGFTQLFYTELGLNLDNSPLQESVERLVERTEQASMGTPHAGAVLALSPFKWQLSAIPLEDHLQTICGELGAHGYVCTYKAKNAQSERTILLDDFRNWQNYGVIAMFTHGGVSGGRVHFDTGVLVRDVPSQYNSDFIAGNLLPANYKSSPDMVTAITPGWFSKYYSGRLNRTLVYISGCSLRENSSLSAAITGQGSAFFAWDNSIGPFQASRTGIDLFTQLLSNERNCGEAYQQLVQNGNAHVENPRSDFGFDGDATLRLAPPWKIVATNPSDGALNAPITTPVAATFSTDINPSTINTNTFKITPSVTGTVAYVDRTAQFFPSSDLSRNTTYTATITTGVKDLAGNSLFWDYSWSFKTAPGASGCDDFPSPPGETWTYRVIGNGYVFSLVTEAVSETIGGYRVLRFHRSDNPPGLGTYVGCDPENGLVFVAYDWWDLVDPQHRGREILDTPEPIELCGYGTPVGSVCEWYAPDEGYDNRVSIEVLAYESVTVPYGRFEEAQKTKWTSYDDGEIDENMVPVYDWEDPNVGLIKELEVDPGAEIGIELTAYRPPGGLARAAVNRIRMTRELLRAVNAGGLPFRALESPRLQSGHRGAATSFIGPTAGKKSCN